MKHILNNISQEEKQTIIEQHSGGKFIDTSSFKRLLESKLGNVKPLVMEQVTGTTTPGDPSQSTVDLSTDYATLKSALATYNNTVNSVMGVDPGLFLRSSNKAPSQLLITSNTRQDNSGQGAGDNWVLRYDIPTATLKRRVQANPVQIHTLALDGNTIGTGPGKGIWFFGLNQDLMKKEKKVEQVKSAANVVGAAIAAFFSKVQTSVPKNYVVTNDRAFADGSAEYIFGPPTA